MKERIDYRAHKWLLQKVSGGRQSDQFDRLTDTDCDILIVLDACRTDTLREMTSWPVDSAISPASCTPEWLTAISESDVFQGAHVISGNPQYKKVDVELGCKTIDPYWESHWNKKLQTTLPEPILERVDKLVTPESNTVVGHLQQPHWPYVAQIGDKWALAYENLGPWDIKNDETNSVQVAMQRGLIDIDKARRAYRASVQSVWSVLNEYLGRWMEEYTVVVTADHGEAFGRLSEFGLYEHPCECHLSPLVNVPWIELHPYSATQKEMDSVEDRLRALGYAE